MASDKQCPACGGSFLVTYTNTKKPLPAVDGLGAGIAEEGVRCPDCRRRYVIRLYERKPRWLGWVLGNHIIVVE